MQRQIQFLSTRTRGVTVVFAVAVACSIMGCQTTGISDASVPPIAAPTTQPAGAPAMNPMNNVAPTMLPSGASAAISDSSVSQVGFTDRVGIGERIAARRGCGACAGCQQSGACQSEMNCGPVPMMPMGRPVDPQEFLCNGGDQAPEAYLITDDTIVGLQAQDAVVHYTTDDGDIEFQASNRVCLYSPRFGSVRQVSGAVAGEKAIGPMNTAQPVGLEGLNFDLPSLITKDIDELGHANVTRRLDAVRDRNRGIPVEQVVEPIIAEDVMQILATLDALSLTRLDDSQIALLQRGNVAARSWMIRDAVEVMIESLLPPTLIRDQSVEALVVYDFPDAGRLEIVKVADKDHAALGEEVQFAIHVRNVGDSDVREVQIADSLVPRLEYVEGSEKSDPSATFETRSNEAGSLRLMWTLDEPLKVGESATIEFRCKVR
ncbi:MAG: DUF11 domain-containing protein [Planctomycetota bacterium]